MAELLLLGQIPGTNIVITFWMWLLVFSLILSMYTLWRVHTKRWQPKQIVLIWQRFMKKQLNDRLDQAAL